MIIHWSSGRNPVYTCPLPAHPEQVQMCIQVKKKKSDGGGDGSGPVGNKDTNFNLAILEIDISGSRNGRILLV